MSAIMLNFATDHPTGDGHFPGNPIIPGAVLLDQAIRAIATAHKKTISGCAIRSAKFLHPVRPGQSVSIEWTTQPSGAISFTGDIAHDTRVMTGSVMFGNNLC